MIVGKQKTIEEIWQMIGPHRNILVLGCNTCVAVCHQGGEKQAEILASLLKIQAAQNEPEMHIQHGGITRQCEHEFFQEHEALFSSADAVLSLACGIGVQFIAERYHALPVYPALNTTFLGARDSAHQFSERCQACGRCVLGETGAICPVSRCAKRLFNGPCGGASQGRCEINRDVPCAWQLIIDRLGALGRMDDYEIVRPLKDWSADRAGGPRSLDIEEEIP